MVCGKEPENKTRNGEPRNHQIRQQYKKRRENKKEEKAK